MSGDDISLFLFFASSNSFCFCFNNLGSAPVKFFPNASAISSKANTVPAATLASLNIPPPGTKVKAANAPSTFSPFRKFIVPLTPVIILPIPDKSPPPPDLVPEPLDGGVGVLPGKAFLNPVATIWNGLIINPPTINLPIFPTSPVIVPITLPIPTLIIVNTPPATNRVLITEFLISFSFFLLSS